MSQQNLKTGWGRAWIISLPECPQTGREALSVHATFFATRGAQAGPKLDPSWAGARFLEIWDPKKIKK